MTAPPQWAFDASPGRITVTSEFATVDMNSRNEAYFLGLDLMRLGIRDAIGPLLDAIKIAWPEPVPPPGAIVVTSNITINPDLP